MTNDGTTEDVPTSNWTLATGTKPGARDAFPTYQEHGLACSARSQVVAGAARREPADAKD